jgi:hypothetical protein
MAWEGEEPLRRERMGRGSVSNIPPKIGLTIYCNLLYTMSTVSATQVGGP